MWQKEPKETKSTHTDPTHVQQFCWIKIGPEYNRNSSRIFGIFMEKVAIVLIMDDRCVFGCDVDIKDTSNSVENNRKKLSSCYCRHGRMYSVYGRSHLQNVAVVQCSYGKQFWRIKRTFISKCQKNKNNSYMLLCVCFACEFVSKCTRVREKSKSTSDAYDDDDNENEKHWKEVETRGLNADM